MFWYRKQLKYCLVEVGNKAFGNQQKYIFSKTLYIKFPRATPNFDTPEGEMIQKYKFGINIFKEDFCRTCKYDTAK